jgi:hypothetical protein
MDQLLLQRLGNLVNKGFFNRSVQDFGPSQDPDQLERRRLYFIRVRQPGLKGIDAIVMYNNTYMMGQYMNEMMSFRQYYFRNLRMSEEDPYNPLQKTDNNINMPIQPDLYIVDITDIIKNASREFDRLNVAYLSDEKLAGPNLLSNLPYSIAPNNGPEQGLVASYLGGKKKRKSTRKKRSIRRRRHSKTKKSH